MKKFIISSFLIISCIISLGTINSIATSDDNDSEITKGQITFYEEKGNNSETDQSNNSQNPNTNKPNDASKPKKTGLLPQTGELVFKILPYVIGISILILLILYQKEKKEKDI